MISLLVLLYCILGVLVCFYSWRMGIYVVLLTGFLQEPVRKLFEGEPVVFTMGAAAMFGVCVVSAFIAGESSGIAQINRWRPYLSLPAGLFIAWVIFSGIRTFFSTGSPVLAGIGLAAYLAPFPALLTGARFARSPSEFERLILFYIGLSLLFGLSIYLEKAGLEWRILGSVGKGFVFYPESGGVSKLFSGLYRSPEVAGWHCAGGICLCLALLMSRRRISPWMWIGAALVVAALFPALLVTGRRKFIVEIVLFLALSGVTIWWFTGMLRGFGPVLSIIAVAMAVFFYYISASESPFGWDEYIERGTSVRQDSVGRFRHMTVDMFQWVIKRNGWLGSGAGTGSQGAQHFGGGAVLVGAAAEGGLGKILAELGVPGILLLAFLGVATLRYLHSIAAGISGDMSLRVFVCSLLAFLGANVVVFTTAHQIFGDLFVLLILGLVVGFVFRAVQLPGALRRGPDFDAPSGAPERIGRRFRDRVAV